MNPRTQLDPRHARGEHSASRRAVRDTGGDIEVAIFNLEGSVRDHRKSAARTRAGRCATASSPARPWFVRCTAGGSIWIAASAVRASLPACVATFPTRVEDGIVLVDVGQRHALRSPPEEVSRSRNRCSPASASEANHHRLCGCERVSRVLSVSPRASQLLISRLKEN